VTSSVSFVLNQPGVNPTKICVTNLLIKEPLFIYNIDYELIKRSSYITNDQNFSKLRLMFDLQVGNFVELAHVL
jgi:hypothetical protein